MKKEKDCNSVILQSKFPDVWFKLTSRGIGLYDTDLNLKLVELIEFNKKIALFCKLGVKWLFNFFI